MEKLLSTHACWSAMQPMRTSVADLRRQIPFRISYFFTLNAYGFSIAGLP